MDRQRGPIVDNIPATSRKRIGDESGCEVGILQKTTISQPMKRSTEQECIAPLRENTPATEAMVILHEIDGDEPSGCCEVYLRGSRIVFRAMRLLEEWKYLPAQISHCRIPFDIIALRDDVTLLIQVISSRRPIPDARTLVRTYAGKIDALRRMRTTAQFRKMLMAYSGMCGWKYYEVLPGGLIPAWHLPDIPAE